MATSKQNRKAQDQKHWERRLASVGRGQSRYLWALLVLGVFFLSLVIPSDGASYEIPGIGIALNPLYLLGIAPSVLCILIIVVIGSLRAYGAAKRELDLGPHSNRPPTADEVKRSEAYDEIPNALDLAVFTRKRFERSPAALLLLNYPAYLTLFLVEAGILWIRFILSTDGFPKWQILAWCGLNSLSLGFGLAATALIAFLWFRRIELIIGILWPGDDSNQKAR
jgi:hypothetical protein